ncbi:hypothetical protein B0H19DRAFT_1011015 [Mycena capillaripes]|nr:hypothetical protein B0H19DRAFT_1011015 [Mycena capillaripes]
MKRGFLNSSKAKARPLGPVPAAPKPPTSNQPGDVMKLPIGKVEKVVVPDGYDSGFRETDPNSPVDPDKGTHLRYTTLPQDVSKDEPVTECFFFHGTKEFLTSLPGFPQPLIHPETPAFRVAGVPGKGMGLFSTRALAAGDLILSERPLLISPAGWEIPYPPNFTREQFVQHSLNEGEKMRKVSVDRMRSGDRVAFMALANCHTEDGSGPVTGIVRTNGLGVSGLRPGVEGPLSQYSAVPKYISRLNHSCSPNTQPRFDNVSLSYRLWAVRDIAAGEELTFQYCTVLCAAAKRNEELKPYGFVCTCPSCIDAPASDARRAAIAAFTPTVSIWAVDRKLSNDWLLEKCAEQLALIETEGLQYFPAYSDATKAMMEAYICLGDAQNASKWAAKVNKQVWAEDYTNIDSLLDPANAAYEAHPMWRMRIGDARPGTFGKIFQDMAALAGPNGITTMPGGAGFMLFPFPSR